MRRWLVAAGGLFSVLQAQYRTEEGFLLPTHDTIYVLVVFAEVDYTACGADPYEAQYGRSWPTDSLGRTRVPDDAPLMLDAFVEEGGSLQGGITRTYAEASFGRFMVLGDYLPEVVRVPCTRLLGGSYSLAQEVGLVVEAWGQRPFRTARGVPWTYFDRWQLLPQRAGLPKLRTPTPFPHDYKPRLDVLFIVWRNLAQRLDIQRPPFPCYYGFGLWICDLTTPFGPFTGGVETASSFTSCATASGASLGFLEEFFHGLYGGNHWHTGGGAGYHTFPFLPVVRGLSMQGIRPMYAVGYDRWLMGWKAPNKAYLISALDEEGREVPTDLHLPPKPTKQRFWLRDFMTTGDVVRIRLPYTEKGGAEVKSQYLWLENRRFIASSEVWAPFLGGDCEDKPPPPLRGWPALYAYIQVGKDRKEDPFLYTDNPAHPNGLGSWLFTVTAEGNYDFAFRATPKGLALDKAASLPNPFTGMNDMYLAVDANGDGKVAPVGESEGLWYLEWKGDSACVSWYNMGDSADGFSFRTQTELSLETNPAPVPVYTLISAEGYRGPTYAQPAPYDNRRIWLSGLYIRLLAERSDGALLIEVGWDHFYVRRPVRWCGTIVVSPNPFDSLAPALDISSWVLLDRSASPVYGVSRGYDSLEKRHWYSDTTVLRIEPQARVVLRRRGRIILRRGSRLELLPGASLTGEGWIEIEPGGQVCLAPGAELKVRLHHRRRRFPFL
ncbi:MAG: hypothetical protein ABDH91_01910 [Bacteroidia bacterium]